jgi:hypothetical protein
MKQHKICVVLLALLLAAMAMVPIVSAAEDAAIQITERRLTTGMITPVFDESEIILKEPVNESEIVSFVFPADWLNSQKTSSDTISITIPRSQLTTNKLNDATGIEVYTNQAIEKTERVALLQIPKELLKQENKANPDQIMLDYPLSYYSFYPDMAELTKAVEQRKMERISKQHPVIIQNPGKKMVTSMSPLASTLYAEWDLWKRTSTSYTPVALRGDMKPDTFSNSGQSTFNYHETEIHLNRDGDIVELLLWYCDDGHIWLSAPIYDEGVLKWGTGGTGMKWIDISSKNRVNYEFYVNSNGQYSINFYNTGTGIWYTFNYNDSDNPSTYINRIVPSTELTTDTVAYQFNSITNTMKAYETKDSGNPSWIGTCQRFSHDYFTGNANYVLLNAYKIGDTIYSYHLAANSQS